MRSIPFRVVCLLGMNDREFPRFQHPQGFDLMAAAPRRGDRSRRDDDRFLFLEAMLCARDVFYVSYQSRDVRDNSERVPSMVVGDLMDYVRRVEPGGAPDLFHQHPLQPFSRRCFTGPVASYAEQWLPVPEPARRAFGDPGLPEPGAQEREVDLAELVDFFANPARHLLRRRLGLALSEGAEAVADSEPFALDPLERYRLRQEVLESGGLDPDAVLARLEEAGAAPHGRFAQLAVADALAPVEPLAEAVVDLTAEPGRAVEVDLAIAGFRLTGWLAEVRTAGLVRYRPARLKARDRVGLWLEHLVLCATAPPGVGHHSRLLMLDGELVLGPVAAPEPLLAALLALYWQGLARPLAFFPETSWAFAEAVKRGWDRERARTAAWRRWQDGYAHAGEGRDVYVDTAWRGAEPLDEAFEDLALRVLEPLMDQRVD